ncbi:MAG: hypothetical protein ABJB11_03810 [Ferruginibacter sp.]
MKRLSILFITVLFYCSATAQAHLVTTDYQKTKQSAIEMELPYAEKIVGDAIEDKMEKMGFKSKSNKGYMVYKGVRIAELGAGTYDLYFKTDRKSRKEKDMTIVTMMMSEGPDRFVSDPTVLTSAKNFLDSQVVMVEAYDLEVQVTEQDNSVKKADKKMSSLVSDLDDLQKKKAKIEKDIEENLKNQENQKKEIETQNLILTTLKGKRKQ